MLLHSECAGWSPEEDGLNGRKGARTMTLIFEMNGVIKGWHLTQLWNGKRWKTVARRGAPLSKASSRARNFIRNRKATNAAA